MTKMCQNGQNGLREMRNTPQEQLKMQTGMAMVALRTEEEEEKKGNHLFFPTQSNAYEDNLYQNEMRQS